MMSESSSNPWQACPTDGPIPQLPCMTQHWTTFPAFLLSTPLLHCEPSPQRGLDKKGRNVSHYVVLVIL
jgi:hypothetical protein